MKLDDVVPPVPDVERAQVSYMVAERAGTELPT